MGRIIIRLIFVLLMIAIIALYVVDIVYNQVSPTKNLFRTISIFCICIVGLLKTRGSGRRSLDFYDTQYSEILKDAFVTQPFYRRKLLCAVRLYNENNIRKAIKYITDLKPLCQTGADHYAVNLFTALCFTDVGQYEPAERVYQQLINMSLQDSRIYSNMGQVQMKAGHAQKALQSYEHALEYDRNNAFAYNNIAQAHFQLYEFDKAIPFAEKALEINPKMHQAAALLAVIYSLENNQAKADKYFHIYVCAGKNPEKLRDTIKFYKANQSELEPEEQ